MSMSGLGAQYLYEEAEAHKRVGELLRKQRDLAAKCAIEELAELNEQLVEAIGDAHAATERRHRALAEMGLDLASPLLRAAWVELRKALRMVRSEAALSQEVAAEMTADVQFLLGLLQPAVEGYGRDGRRCGRGPALLDSAA
ncbi:MAG: flagellar export chaperone FlgN [Armatimonadetes bacterium]|nr:flagellar export chaperone FlgN [Armatimonadota bacterium]